MNLFGTIFGMPLGYIMWGCYLAVGNIGVAIIIFTIIVKAAMFPLSVKQQKNTSKTQLFTPRIKEIQTKYRGNTEKMNEEMAKLSKEGYNPMGGCLPAILTLALLLGVLDVVYKPLTHFERIDKADIGIVKEIAIETELQDYITEENEKIDKTNEENGNNEIEYINSDSESAVKQKENLEKRLYVPLRAELRAIGAFKNHPEVFMNSDRINPETIEKLERLGDRIIFLGIDFSQIPDRSFPIIIIPILSFIFSIGSVVVTQIVQKKNSPEAAQQMGAMKYMLYFMPVISLMIAFQFPAGAGFYWSLSSLLGIAQSIIIFKMYPPEKLKAEVLEALEKRGYKENVVVIEKYDNKTSSVISTEKKVSEMSSNEKKEYYRKKLEEARRADLDKYGEVGAPPSENPQNENEQEKQ